MERRFTLTVVLAVPVVLALTLAANVAMAQGPKGSPKAVTAALGTAFTYQGQLKLNGTPVNGNCYLQFRLYADASGTNLVAGPLNGSPNPVNVSNGNFTVQIDFGSGVFQGDARWLQTLVKCGSDSTYTPLSLQLLTPAPYTMYSAKTGPHSHWGDSWSGAGSGLSLRSTDGNGLVGTGAAGMLINPIPLGVTAGVYGESPQAGVWGQTYNASGLGVAGANSSSGNYGQLGTSNYGVYGASPSGIGVEGINTNKNNWGDLGTSSSGVHGYGLGTGSDGVIGGGYNGGNGVTGFAVNGGYGVFSLGDMRATGNLQVDGQAIGFFPRPAYDSGWVVLGFNCLTLNHNLGGDAQNYLVDITTKAQSGINNISIGGYYDTSGNIQGQVGYWYRSLTSTSVDICAGLATETIRLRIWVYK